MSLDDIDAGEVANTVGGEIVSESSRIDRRITTGIYALNKIVSGSVYEGIPVGKCVGIYGESDTGKCVTGDMEVKVRDKETGETYTLTIEEFFEIVS